MTPGDVDRVVILCGGRGTRLQGAGPDLPKPLVEIGGRPILWHVVRIYAAQGFTRFLLCAGHRAAQIDAFARAADWPAGIEVATVDTGEATPTGGRIHHVGDRLDGGTFCVTYADGLADIDLRGLLTHHAAHGDLATLTAVRPPLPFGVVELGERDCVTGFREKPRADHWVNGGFFVFEPGVLAYLGPSSTLEREPLEGLAGDRQLHAYRHTGFWACMDTYKDAVALDDLWVAGRPPWRVWG